MIKKIAKTKAELPFFLLWEKFISDSRRGKRLQPNGKRISTGTLNNYHYTKQLVVRFSLAKNFLLRLRPVRYLTKREMIAERNYWKKFYRSFTNFLYSDLGYFDNYVGQNIRIIKTFFNYLNKDLALSIGDFHRCFYVRKEEIPIYPLLPEELNFLIYDQEFAQSLSARMLEAKDVFVLGCTTALRVSDLLSLKRSSLRATGDIQYLSVRSKKTGTGTMIQLPEYAREILKKYERQKKCILPRFNKVNFNEYIKKLLEKAGFTQEVDLRRDCRGISVALQKNGKVRFCDIASSHTMRRTAITMMLCLGMPEQVVRKISGHAPGTKEFYRYVGWAQMYQDQESTRVFEKLRERSLAS